MKTFISQYAPSQFKEFFDTRSFARKISNIVSSTPAFRPDGNMLGMILFVSIPPPWRFYRTGGR